jgi:hypothetical protein
MLVRGIFCQEDGHHGDMPGVLGVVFVSRPIQQKRPPVDLFKLIKFANEINLFTQTVIHDRLIGVSKRSFDSESSAFALLILQEITVYRFKRFLGKPVEVWRSSALFANRFGEHFYLFNEMDFQEFNPKVRPI